VNDATVNATVRAPGKLMIAGEYAVLDGGPALVLAIDRGVRCEISASPTLEIETPDGDDRFVRPALSSAPIARYRFSHWNPTSLPEKPGFGGSAAACVAACVAASRPAADAFELHRQAQGGGSGADVAAAIHGGMIRIDSGRVSPVEPVHPVVIWSGRSAKTQPLIQCYLRWTERQNFVANSRALVDAFSENPVQALRENARVLVEMAARAGLPYMTETIAAIAVTARDLGGAAKPSGAGGGDCAIALFDERDAQERFITVCAQNNWTVIPVGIASGAARRSG
jgi:phosphomevalonate kinase